MIGDYYRYTTEAGCRYKLAEVTENASKYYQQATEAAGFLDIKEDRRRTNYDVIQMNLELFLIT